jgi:cytochrome c oxidase assembly protein subunit 15
LQFATGLSNVVLGWPLLAAVMHTGGAAAMALTLTWALSVSRADNSGPSLLSKKLAE